MKLYRIYTEDKNRSVVQAIVAEHFKGVTFFTGQGLWEGTIEDSLIIEILADEDEKTIDFVAKRIKHINRQDAVLVTSQEVMSKLL